MALRAALRVRRGPAAMRVARERADDDLWEHRDRSSLVGRGYTGMEQGGRRSRVRDPTGCAGAAGGGHRARRAAGLAGPGGSRTPPRTDDPVLAGMDRGTRARV